jgi:hypothetical protein
MRKAALALGVALNACMLGSAMAASVVVNHTNWNWYDSQSQAVFDRVGNLKIFFAHASVGSNMSAGVTYWHGQNAAKFKLVVTSDDGTPPAPTVAGRFYHYARGNPSWSEKVSSFETYVANGWKAPNVDFTMNKFCYIDQDASATDYLNSMATMQTANPTTKLVYMTMPLMTTTDNDAILRNDFNTAVRQYAASHDVILYDIADIEAWSPAGVEQTFTSGVNVYQRLYDGYTDDGGHPSTLEGYSRLGMALYSLFGLATETATSYTLTVSVSGDGGGTITSSPAGISCGADCTEAFTSGTVVTLTTSAVAGSSFAGWSGGGCSGLGPCHVTMNAAYEVEGVFVADAGASAFYPVAPCRAIDTRLDSGPTAGAPVLAASSRRDFSLTGKCSIPSGAKAISANLTVVGATASGDLRVIASHVPSTITSALSIPLTRARANNAIVQLSNDGLLTISVINPTAGDVHFILDIDGYFL